MLIVKPGFLFIYTDIFYSLLSEKTKGSHIAKEIMVRKAAAGKQWTGNMDVL